MNSTATRRFHKLCLASLVAVYFLILVGGVVRSTGSGMGCPDWPTCFGQWVPPTSVDQLPADYKEKFASYREKKNIKFARYLSLIGLDDTASKILDDKSVMVEADFNPAKTWVEYLNRVVGVVIGLFIIALFYSSWKIRSVHPELFRWSLFALVLVIFQGWFGSIVVSTNLTSWTITVHMFLALLLVMNLVWLQVRSGTHPITSAPGAKRWLIVVMVLMLIQIFLGTEVRGVLDSLAASMERNEWISNAGAVFVIHRSFSWLLLAIQVGWWYWLRKTSSESSLTLVPLLLILGSVATGTGMAYGGVPPFLQPIHLLLALLTFGWYFKVFLQINIKPVGGLSR